MELDVVIYTKNVCPYCTMAKALLDQKGISYVVQNAEDPEIFEEMMAKSGGRRTVPQIFINGKAIGGFDDLNALHQSGEL